MKPLGAFVTGCAGLSLTPDEIVFLQTHNPWGLIVFKRNCQSPDQLRMLTAGFRDAVGRKDAPVFVDQEGGRVQRLGPPSNSWPQYPPARNFGDLYETRPIEALRAARNVARLMAEQLIDAGITANCTPVLDVPQSGSHDVIGNRAYSMKAERVTALARATAAGFMEGGVLPVIKHIPGHGRAQADSHHGLPVVDAPLAELRAIDFLPFAAFADAPMAMTAHVVYTAIDSQAPATLSAKVIRKVIRKEIGFGGLLMTDDLSMKALTGTITEKCQRSLAAGCDIILHCNGVLAEMQEVAGAAGILRGKSLRRARAALKTRRKPQPFDRKSAMADLKALVSG